jgi:hypothetical protein
MLFAPEAMGRELQCRAKSAGKWHEGKALLETNEIIFRGDIRLKMPLGSLTSVVARDGQLHLKWGNDSAILELGEQAEKWAHKILHPKSTAEKLGIKPGLNISFVNVANDQTMEDAQATAAWFADKQPLKNSDIIFFGAATADELTKIKKLLPFLAGNGALWVVYPKGRKEITEVQVLNAGRAAGLYDVKVVGYSPTHTALKFVRPKDKR